MTGGRIIRPATLQQNGSGMVEVKEHNNDFKAFSWPADPAVNK